VLDATEDLIGPDILCWGTSLRAKQPDGKTFAGWHQDTAYADVKPIVVIVALALSPARTENGCIRGIPGSHRGPLLPHKEAGGIRNQQPALTRAVHRRRIRPGFRRRFRP